MQQSRGFADWQIGLVVLIGVAAISTGAILVRLATQAAGIDTLGFSLVMAAGRLTFAAIFLLPTWPKIPWSSLQPQALPYAIAAGVCLALHFAAWITSLSYTSIAASTTLVTTTPIWVAILSYFYLKEPLSKLTGLGILIALMGGIGIGLEEISPLEGGNSSMVGNGLALLGAWTVSFYLILGRSAQRRGLAISSYVRSPIVLRP